MMVRLRIIPKNGKPHFLITPNLGALLTRLDKIGPQDVLIIDEATSAVVRHYDHNGRDHLVREG